MPAGFPAEPISFPLIGTMAIAAIAAIAAIEATATIVMIATIVTIVALSTAMELNAIQGCLYFARPEFLLATNIKALHTRLYTRGVYPNNRNDVPRIDGLSVNLFTEVRHRQLIRFSIGCEYNLPRGRHTMQNLFEQKGRLAVSIGEGYISAYEASMLKAGDIVETANLAGEGYPVYFNGHFLFTAEVVIIGRLVALRIKSLFPSRVEAQLPANPDEVIEMLPFMVRFAEIEISLRELEGVSPGTIINLDKLYSEKEDAQLIVAGIAVAKGKVGVLFENMTLRITEVIAELETSSDLQVRSSGSLVDMVRLGERCKDYDFKRPDKFSRNAVERMKELHGLFMRNLQLKHRIFGDYELIGDQLTFGELFQGFHVEDYNYLLIHSRPWSRRSDAAQETDDRRSRSYFVEPAHARHPATEEQKEFIRKVVKRDQREFADGMFLLLSKTAPVKELADSEEDRSFLLASLRGAWKSVAPMNFQLAKRTDRMDEIKIIHENEMILLIIVRDSATKLDLMYIVYPYLTLEPYMGVLK